LGTRTINRTSRPKAKAARIRGFANAREVHALLAAERLQCRRTPNSGAGTLYPSLTPPDAPQIAPEAP
jgi:hypothetical protein